MKYRFLCFLMAMQLCLQGQVKDISNEWLLGKIDYHHDSRFKVIPKSYSTKENLILHAVALDSLMKMIDSAKKDGIELKIISAIRSFSDQKRIWDRKYEERKHRHSHDIDVALDILNFSSMPGTSRHHWGTDIDLNSLSPAYFSKGKGKIEYEWLCKNATQFGFYQPYSSDPNRTGYQPEPWHWSFYPIADSLLHQYNQNINYRFLTGYRGADAAQKIDVIKYYVNGIAIHP